MRFNCCMAIIVLSLFGTLSGLCQNGGKIQLSGSVVSVTPASTTSNKKEYEYFDVHLYLQFHNLTDRRLIIFKPDSFLGTFTKEFLWGKTRMSFSDSLKTEMEADLFVERLWRDSDPTYSAYEPLAHHMMDLATSEPNPTYFAKIEPQSYYECHVTLSIDNGYRKEQRVGRSPKDIYSIAIPEYSELKLKYFLSTKKLSGKIDLLSAQQKWKKFGELVLDSDGDYYIESDIIRNKPAE